MSSGKTPEDRVVSDFSVTTQSDRIGHDDSVPRVCIMSHVCGGHQKIVVSHKGKPVLLGCCPVNGHEFLNKVAIADGNASLLSPVPDVLRRRSDGNKREDPVPLTQFRVAFNDNMAFDLRVPSNSHVLSNHAVRTYPDVFSQFGARVHDSRGVDLRR